jgi:hypothetical protein
MIRDNMSFGVMGAIRVMGGVRSAYLALGMSLLCIAFGGLVKGFVKSVDRIQVMHYKYGLFIGIIPFCLVSCSDAWRFQYESSQFSSAHIIGPAQHCHKLVRPNTKALFNHDVPNPKLAFLKLSIIIFGFAILLGGLISYLQSHPAQSPLSLGKGSFSGDNARPRSRQRQLQSCSIFRRLVSLIVRSSVSDCSDG